MTATVVTPDAEPLTPAEAAARANASERSVYRWIAEGKLPARRCQTSGRLRIRAGDVDRLVEGLPVVPATPAPKKE